MAMSVPGPESSVALSATGLQVTYGSSVRALNGVDVVVNRGAVTALLGANGAGKTTLLRALAGVVDQYRGAVVGGEIELFGQRVTGVDSSVLVRRGLSLVPEGRRVFTTLSVEENLRAGAVTVASRSRRRAAEEQMYEKCPILAERRRQLAGYLSGGEQQMLAIGRALMAEPQVLLLDEPCLGLAPLIIEQVASIVEQIAASGTSVLLVEQNASVALRIAERGYVMANGRIVLAGTRAELMGNPEIREHYLGMATQGRRSFRFLPNAATEVQVG